jgi:fatty-acyl-CoA synthase
MNVVGFFDQSARNYPENLAFTGAGGDITYRAAQLLSNRVARACLREGIGKNSRSGCISPNNGLAMTAILGGMRANTVWCNVNLRDAPENIIDVLKRGKVELLFYHSSASELIKAVRKNVDSLKIAVCIDREDENGTYLEDWIAGESETMPQVKIDDNDIGLQAATGGTTGNPKLAVSSHLWLSLSILGISLPLHFEKPPVYLAVAPITHVGGLIAHYTLSRGGTNVMMEAPDLDLILDAVSDQGITLMFLPPTLTYMLLKHPRSKEIDFSSLKYLISSAAPIAPDKTAEAMNLFGPVMVQMYGQSEAGLPVTCMWTEDYVEALSDPAKKHRLASCGRQSPIIDNLEIVDGNDNILGPDEKGEIVLRGPTAMKYYLDDPDATAEIQQNGWHHTGDIGYRDEDGFFYIVDRKRDMVVSGGFNIFPLEIEQVLLAHPDVQDCAVIGVPDEKWGEAVKAVIVHSPGSAVSDKELQNFCRKSLGGMKTPKSVDFVDDLPKSAAGKILKRIIREKYWGEQKRKVH